MKIVVEGVARVRSLTRAREYDIHPDELDWHHNVDERQMGPAITYTAGWSSDDEPDIGVQWQLVEYPANAQNWSQTHVHGVQLLADFVYRLEHEDDAPLGD